MIASPPGVSAAEMTDSEFAIPFEIFVVPSTGSSAMSNRGEPSFQVPSLSPRNMPGALSFIPSPITTSPRMSTKSNTP